MPLTDVEARHVRLYLARRVLSLGFKTDSAGYQELQLTSAEEYSLAADCVEVSLKDSTVPNPTVYFKDYSYEGLDSDRKIENFTESYPTEYVIKSLQALLRVDEEVVRGLPGYSPDKRRLFARKLIDASFNSGELYGLFWKIEKDLFWPGDSDNNMARLVADQLCFLSY